MIKSLTIFEGKTLKDYINIFIVFYAFSLPLSKAGVTLFGVVLILLWVIEKNFKYKWELIKSNLFFIVLGLFFCWSVISLFWSNDLYFALKYLKKYWHFLIMPVIFTSLQKEYISKILMAFLFGILISAVVSYGIFFEVWTYKNIPAYDPSPFMDHTNHGIYLAFAIFILFHKILEENTFKLKFFYIICTFVVLFNLFIISGRTGQVAFFISLFFVVFFNYKFKFKWFLISIITSLVIFISAYSLSPVFKSRFDYTINDISNIYKFNDYSGGFGQRVALWKIGTNVFQDNWVLGTGIGDEFDNSEEYIKELKLQRKLVANINNYLDYHNAFIQYSVQLGVVGLSLFLLLFYYLFKLKFNNQIYENLNRTFLVLLLLLSMVGLSLHIMASMVLFSLFSGVFIGISRLDKENGL